MVQARHDQHAVEHSIREQAEGPGVQHRAAERVHAGLELLPLQAKDSRQQQAREPTENRHEAPSSEEGEIARQADLAEAVVQDPCDQPGEDTGRNAQLAELASLVGFGGQISRLTRQSRERIVRNDDQDLSTLSGNEVANDRGQTGRAVVFPSESDGHADGKQQAEIVENGAPSRGHRGDVEQIRLTEAQEKTRDG